MSRVLVLEAAAFAREAIAMLRDRAEVVERDEPIDLATAFRDFDAVLLRLGCRVDAVHLDSDVRCRVLGVPATGLDHVDVAACAAAGIEVVSLRGRQDALGEVSATAEHALGLLLALARHTVRAHEHVEHGGWDRDLFRGTQLRGLTAGVVGVGRLGTMMASYLSALGMKVVGFDLNAELDPGTCTPTESLHELLAVSDVVSIHVTYDESTHHLLDAEALSACKVGVLIVNTSRGAVIDEAALCDALIAGRIGGAALDVLEGEPDVAESPIVAYARSHDNVLLTPHLGGNTTQSTAYTDLLVVRGVLEALEQRSR